MDLRTVKNDTPRHGWVGLGLVIIFWILNWTLPGMRTHWGFFPLWLGYSLVIDALVYNRKGTSLFTRNPYAYIGLFLISAPAWWLFEVINWRIQNWYYIGREVFSPSEYFILASLSFSTVMPAVFGTAELVSTFDWVRRLKPGWKIVPTRSTTLKYFAVGWIMLALMLLWPRYFFPFVWLSIFFIVEPINVWLSSRSLTKYTAVGDWRPIVSLLIGCLICGFFWEMWNFYSNPKWIYTIPFVSFLHIFEMPLLGYGGYFPFALELFAVYHFVIGFFKRSNLNNFIQFSSD